MSIGIAYFPSRQLTRHNHRTFGYDCYRDRKSYWKPWWKGYASRAAFERAKRGIPVSIDYHEENSTDTPNSLGHNEYLPHSPRRNQIHSEIHNEIPPVQGYAGQYSDRSN